MCKNREANGVTLGKHMQNYSELINVSDWFDNYLFFFTETSGQSDFTNLLIFDYKLNENFSHCMASPSESATLNFF